MLTLIYSSAEQPCCSYFICLFAFLVFPLIFIYLRVFEYSARDCSKAICESHIFFLFFFKFLYFSSLCCGRSICSGWALERWLWLLVQCLDFTFSSWRTFAFSICRLLYDYGGIEKNVWSSVLILHTSWDLGKEFLPCGFVEIDLHGLMAPIADCVLESCHWFVSVCCWHLWNTCYLNGHMCKFNSL